MKRVSIVSFADPIGQNPKLGYIFDWDEPEILIQKSGPDYPKGFRQRDTD
jgi:hypothetical protein